MGVRERPHNHFTLLQASGADDAEAVRVVTVTRTIVDTKRHTAVPSRVDPAATAENAVGAC